MTKIATKTYSFPVLRNNHNVYVDKTRYFYRLVTTDQASASFFISRPRRFGKSLMISTLECIFQRRRELFEGTYLLDESDYDWPEVKVLHFDMSLVPMIDPGAFTASLTDYVCSVLEEAGYACDRTKDVCYNFYEGLKALAAVHGPVAVLIDEYDAPIARVLQDKVLAEQVLNTLFELYKFLKGGDPFIRFIMMTGVSKFYRTSEFSALNNGTDISFAPEYAGMLGYTDDELETYFRADMQAHAGVMGCSYEAYRKALKAWFDGYRFTSSEVSVYNPVSIAKTLLELPKAFRSPWAHMARPTVLGVYLRRHDVQPQMFEEEQPVSVSDLMAPTSVCNIAETNLFYQTGYLTIARYDAVSDVCLLKFPNEEIRRDFYAFAADMRVSGGDCRWCSQSLTDLAFGKTDRFVGGLPALFAGMNYGSTEANTKPGEKKVKEFNYQRILQGVFRAGGYFPQPECVQSNGARSDLIVRMADVCYVFEFKNGQDLTAQDALHQIHDRGYAKPYLGIGIRVCAIGLAFDPDTHELTDTAVEWL